MVVAPSSACLSSSPSLHEPSLTRPQLVTRPPPPPPSPSPAMLLLGEDSEDDEKHEEDSGAGVVGTRSAPSPPPGTPTALHVDVGLAWPPTAEGPVPSPRGPWPCLALERGARRRSRSTPTVAGSLVGSPSTPQSLPPRVLKALKGGDAGGIVNDSDDGV